jgi:hypothetical protein
MRQLIRQANAPLSYGSSCCHWRAKIHAEKSRTFRLLAKRQPPSCRSGAMARSVAEGLAQSKTLPRISGIIVSRAASWTALPPLFPEAYQPVPMLTGTAIFLSFAMETSPT